MRRFLFLDDNPKRHAHFKTLSIGCDVTYVWTAEECISVLSNEKSFDCVFLDHDLGGKEFVEEEPGSVSEVAKFIRDQLEKERYPNRIIVHSWNTEGAKRMISYIGPTGINVKYVPFWFSES